MVERLLLVALGAALVLGPLLAVLAALLERSGPIRLRHWAQEAGTALRSLYGRPHRFEAYRFLLSLASRLTWAALYGLLATQLAAAGAPHPFAVAFAPLFVLIGAAELANRRLVGRHPEESLRRLTGLLGFASWALRPLLPLVAPLLPAPPAEGEEQQIEEEASRAEIEAFIAIGRREGILEAAEGELVRGVVGFGDTLVRSVMTPRIDMVCAPLEATPREVAELVLASGHTRLPIYRSSVDEIVGILHVRDLLRAVLRDGSQVVAEILQPPHFVPETKGLTQLLRELQERHQEVAIVVDEYGGTQGMVTIEDLLEEIFGEVGDTPDALDPAVIALPGGLWRVAGRTHLEDLGERLGVPLATDDWETVGGLIFGLLGHVPRVGDVVEAHGLRFVVEAADHRRARRVRVEPAVAVVEAREEA